MNKILPIGFNLSITMAPVLSWGEGGFFFSNKNKESQGETIRQVESPDSSDK